jgi:hypothetical protein
MSVCLSSLLPEMTSPLGDRETARSRHPRPHHHPYLLHPPPALAHSLREIASKAGLAARPVTPPAKNRYCLAGEPDNLGCRERG